MAISTRPIVLEEYVGISISSHLSFKINLQYSLGNLTRGLKYKKKKKKSNTRRDLDGNKNTKFQPEYKCA